MDGNLKKSPQLGCPDDTDAKYISGLSTILVATIQETKDRISQIEYIFCSQIYPNFNSKYKSLQKLYSEARDAAEAAWKEKERVRVLQIERLQSEKHQFQDEIQFLKLEREKFANMAVLSPGSISLLQEELSKKTKEVEERREAQENLSGILSTKNSLIVHNEKLIKQLEEKNLQLLRRQKDLEAEIEALKWEHATKSKEIDEGMRLQNKLLELVQSKTSLIVDQEKQLKAYEERETLLLSRHGSMNKKVDELQQEVREKTEEVEKARELQENMLKKVDSQSLEVMKHEQLLSRYGEEKRMLISKLEKLENDVDLLQKEIADKNIEFEEGRKLQEQLLQQIDIHKMERLKTGKEFEELEKEKQQVLAKLKTADEKVDRLHVNLWETKKESSEGMELHAKLLQQIEAKDSELTSERRKRKEAITAYKKLKSQYNFLCAKYGLITENKIPLSKVEDESELLRHNQSPLVQDVSKIPNASDCASQENKWKDQQVILEDNKGVQPIQRSSSVSPSTSRTVTEPKSTTNVKSCPQAGTKRPVSYWRDTRSHQSRLGPDLHDDFLDTPMEKVTLDLGKAMNDEIHNLPEPAQKDVNFDESDDETQDMNVDLGPNKQPMPPPRPGTSNYKYVEPVRKKAEREKLKGIECKQCKKFYDAVLPDESKETNGNKHKLRCEHNDGVSRHRYRYAPPLTPEGFWNIGFESEM